MPSTATDVEMEWEQVTIPILEFAEGADLAFDTLHSNYTSEDYLQT